MRGYDNSRKSTNKNKLTLALLSPVTTMKQQNHNRTTIMSLGPRKEVVRIEGFRDSPALKDRIEKIMEATGANHTDVMRELIRRGLDDYEGSKNVKS